MRVPPLVAMALISLRHHALRSLLAMLGIVFGVSAVIAMMAISEGARSAALSSINEMGISNILIRSRKPADDKQADKPEGMEYISSYGLTLDEAERLVGGIPSLASSTFIRETTRKLQVGSRLIDVRMVATDPEFARLANLVIADGRQLGDLDMKRYHDVVVLGADVVRESFRARDPLGQDVRIGGQVFTVVGVLTHKRSGGGGGLSADELNRTVFIPETTARMRFGLLDVRVESGSWQAAKVEVTALILHFDDNTDVIARGALARRIVARQAERPDVEVIVPLELLEQQRRTQRIFSLVMSSIASISLLVGGIGIMNIMLATVLERTREIGIRRAVGARARDILAQFLVETVVLSLSGGVVGLILGIGGATLVSRLAGWPTHITLWSVVLAIGISAVVGVVFGLYPAAKAARMQPVTALSHV